MKSPPGKVLKKSGDLSRSSLSDHSNLKNRVKIKGPQNSHPHSILKSPLTTYIFMQVVKTSLSTLTSHGIIYTSWILVCVQACMLKSTSRRF